MAALGLAANGCSDGATTPRASDTGVAASSVVSVATPPNDGTVSATGWHDDVNAKCAEIMGSAEGGATEALIADTQAQLVSWIEEAPGDAERAALTAAADALGSSDTRADLDAMDAIGHQLEAAGLATCGSMFISGQ